MLNLADVIAKLSLKMSIEYLFLKGKYSIVEFVGLSVQLITVIVHKCLKDAFLIKFGR